MMNLLLLILMIYMIVEIGLGIKRGLVKSVLLLVSWVASICGAAFLIRECLSKGDSMKEVVAFFEGFVGTELAWIAAFVTAFLVLVILMKLCFHIVIRLSGVVSEIPVIGGVNRFLGGVFGCLKGLLLVGIILLVYSVYDGSYVGILREEFPRLMVFVDNLRQYLEQLWNMI